MSALCSIRTSREARRLRCRAGSRLACLYAVLAVFVGCRRAPESAVIGVAFNLTDSTVLALLDEELTSGAGADDIRLSIWFEPELPGESPDLAVARAERLIAIESLVGIAGHLDSRSSLAAAEVYRAAGVPQIVPIGTNRQLAEAGPWTFMLAPTDSVEGYFIASFVAQQLDAGSVSVFFQNNDYGIGLRDGVLAGLAAHGVDLITQVAFDTGSDFPTLVAASLRQGMPDALLVAGYSRETISVTLAAYSLAPQLRIVTGDGVLAGFGPRLAEEAGSAVDSLYAVAFWLPSRPDSVSRNFVRRFRATAGREPAPSEAMLFDAVLALANAVRTVGADCTAIRDYLAGLGSPWPALEGVTGPIAFARTRPENLVMVRLRNGQVQAAVLR